MLKTSNPKFPEFCAGVTVAYNEIKGRHVVATQDLPPGTVVCVETGITVNISKAHCYRCLGDITVDGEVYCSSCEKFENEPEELANGEFDELGLFKLAAHIIFSYDFGEIMEVLRAPDPVVPNEAPTQLSTSNFSSIMQLRPLPTIGDAFQNEHIQKNIQKMVKLLEKNANWGKIDQDMRYIFFSRALRLVAERLAKNSHVVFSIEQTSRNSSEEPLGTGIFPISSIFNHSCTPNIFGFFLKNRFIFISRGVKNGEELVDNYGVTHYQNSLTKRKEFLAQVSGFKCFCEKCVKNDRSLNDLLVSNLKNVEEIVENGIGDIDDFLEYIPPGNKDCEVIIQHFTRKNPQNPKKNRQLWMRFIENAKIRGIEFDEYLVRPYLEALILSNENSTNPTKNDLIFTVYQILHVLYADLHPASGIIAKMLEENSVENWETQRNELEVSVRNIWT